MDLRRHQIDESELLAFIEREPMAADRAEAVRTAIAADAVLRDLVQAMRDDRAALAAMGEVRAPSTLLEGVEARLEREALVGLSRVQSSAGLPVSQIVPERESVIATIFTRPWARQLAMAAGIVLAVGVGYFVVRTNWPTPKAREFARGNAMPADAQPARSDFSAGAAHANTSTPSIDVASASPAASSMADPQATKPTVAEGPSVASAEKAEPAAEPAMTIDRAVALAKQGRLVVRLPAADLAGGHAKLDSLRIRTGAWLAVDRAAPAEGPEIAESVQLAVLASRPQPVSPPTMSPEAPAYAGDGHTAAPRPVAPPAAALPELTALRLGDDVYCLSMLPDDDHLRAVLQRLSGGDRDLASLLQEVDRPIELAAPLSLDTMLWWNRAPVNWDRRFVLPVVVELP